MSDKPIARTLWEASDLARKAHSKAVTGVGFSLPAAASPCRSSPTLSRPEKSAGPIPYPARITPTTNTLRQAQRA